MAEFIGGKGLDLTRAALKKYYSTGHRMYPFFAPNMWDIFKVEDDFDGPIIETNKWTVGNGGGASAASFAVSVGRNSGQISGVTGTAGDNTASATITSGRHFRGDQNPVMICRLTVDVITSVKIEVGFRDAITTTAAAHNVVDVRATPTFTATDGVVWILDTNDNVYWEGVAVANGTAATTVEAAISPVASTFEYLQVALVDGVAFYSRFDANGRRTYGPIAQAAAVTATVLLAPFVCVEARNASSKELFVDYIWAGQARSSTP